jgi:hypothetical protein
MNFVMQRVSFGSGIANDKSEQTVTLTAEVALKSRAAKGSFHEKT